MAGPGLLVYRPNGYRRRLPLICDLHPALVPVNPGIIRADIRVRCPRGTRPKHLTLVVTFPNRPNISVTKHRAFLFSCVPDELVKLLVILEAPGVSQRDGDSIRCPS